MPHPIQIKCDNCQGLLKIKEAPQVLEGECLYCSHLIDLRKYFPAKETAETSSLGDREVSSQPLVNQEVIALQTKLNEQKKELKFKESLISNLQNQLDAARENFDCLKGDSKKLESLKAELAEKESLLQIREEKFSSELRKFEAAKELFRAEKLHLEQNLELQSNGCSDVSEEKRALTNLRERLREDISKLEEEKRKFDVYRKRKELEVSELEKIARSNLSESSSPVTSGEVDSSFKEKPLSLVERRFDYSKPVPEPSESELKLVENDAKKGALSPNTAVVKISEEVEVDPFSDIDQQGGDEALEKNENKSKAKFFKFFTVLLLIGAGALVFQNLSVFQAKQAAPHVKSESSPQLEETAQAEIPAEQVPDLVLDQPATIAVNESLNEAVIQEATETVEPVVAKPQIKQKIATEEVAIKLKKKSFDPHEIDLNSAGSIGTLPKALFGL